jgi:hypothetical protein
VRLTSTAANHSLERVTPAFPQAKTTPHTPQTWLTATTKPTPPPTVASADAVTEPICDNLTPKRRHGDLPIH